MIQDIREESRDDDAPDESGRSEVTEQAVDLEDSEPVVSPAEESGSPETPEAVTEREPTAEEPASPEESESVSEESVMPAAVARETPVSQPARKPADPLSFSTPPERPTSGSAASSFSALFSESPRTPVPDEAPPAETPSGEEEASASPQAETSARGEEAATESPERTEKDAAPAEKPARKRPSRRREKEKAKEDEPPVVLDAEGNPVEFNWYVLRVQSGREDTCSNALQKKVVLAKMDRLIREIAVPKQKVTEIKDGKRRIRSQKLFPGYIFIHMALDDDLWYLIRDTSGIGDFVGSHQRPIPMPPEEVRKIKTMMEEKEETPEVKIDLIKNDMVKIKEGPFENFDGVVEEVHPGKGMVRVMVTIFGRATPVDLEYWQVEKL